MYTSTIVTVTVSALAVFAQARPVKLKALNSMSGDATYYDVDLGSCGEINDNDEMVAALSIDLMKGPYNPYCGETIRIKIKVKVVNTCPGRSKESVDLSSAAFKKLGNLDQGRIPVTWSMLKK